MANLCAVADVANLESCRRSRTNLRIVMLRLRLGEIVRGLQIEPKTRVGAKVPSETGSRLSAVTSRSPAHDLGDPIWRHAEVFCDRARRKAEESGTPHGALRRGGCVRAPCSPPSMIVYDLDIFRPFGSPLKANAPLPVDPNAVLAAPTALEGFELIAWR